MTARPDPKEQCDTGTPLERLTRLIQAKGCLTYHEDLPDREYPSVRCSIYGAPKTNELFVKLYNGHATFVEAVLSDLVYPPMADRIFGMDVADHQKAFGLAESMWVKHRDALIQKPSPAKQA